MTEKIPIEPVDSSNLSGYGYNAGTHQLDIAFKSGDIWRYAGVPETLALEFANAESKGKFFNAHVRGKFSPDKMTGPCPACGDKGWIGEVCTDCGTQHYIREERKA